MFLKVANILQNYNLYLLRFKTFQATDKKGKETTMSARRFIIATGERPRYPDIEGAREYGITRYVCTHEEKILKIKFLLS